MIILLYYYVSNVSECIIIFLSIASGVSSVETNVEQKKVTVQSEGLDEQVLVEKLANWSKASGKYVRLAK